MDKTIPLSKEFEANSTVIILDDPHWRVPDSIFNIDLGFYAIENSKTSWRSLDSTLVSRKKDSNIINYILFDDALSVITEEFKVEGSQSFSFNLLQEHSLISSSNCEVFSQSSAEEITTGDIKHSKKSSSSIQSTRLKTFLVCAITHDNKLWELTLKSYKDDKVEVKLRSHNLYYDIKEVSEIISLEKNGNTVEQKNSPPWLSLNSGLEFFKDTKQVAALSFVGKPKIWLKQGLSTKSNELLLTISYSLIMFNWLDSEWR